MLRVEDLPHRRRVQHAQRQEQTERHVRVHQRPQHPLLHPFARVRRVIHHRGHGLDEHPVVDALEEVLPLVHDSREPGIPQSLPGGSVVVERRPDLLVVIVGEVRRERGPRPRRRRPLVILHGHPTVRPPVAAVRACALDRIIVPARGAGPLGVVPALVHRVIADVVLRARRRLFPGAFHLATRRPSHRRSLGSRSTRASRRTRVGGSPRLLLPRQLLAPVPLPLLATCRRGQRAARSTRLLWTSLAPHQRRRRQPPLPV